MDFANRDSPIPVVHFDENQAPELDSDQDTTTKNDSGKEQSRRARFGEKVGKWASSKTPEAGGGGAGLQDRLLEK